MGPSQQCREKENREIIEHVIIKVKTNTQQVMITLLFILP
jgi:hypothetical protein